MTTADIQTAVAQLSRSQHGRATLQRLLDWLDHEGLDLDGENQEAVCTLLAGAWGGLAGTTLDLMRDAK